MLDRRPVLRLQAYIEAAGFKGYDPYDALNSPILSGLSLGNKVLRIAFIQLLKRLPVNLRPLLFANLGSGITNCEEKGAATHKPFFVKSGMEKHMRDSTIFFLTIIMNHFTQRI